MDETTRKQLKQIERQVDADYAASFPNLGSWEASDTHLLMAHECAMLGSDPVLTADLSKYPIMHALRFGKNSPSRPDWSIPVHLNVAALSKARDCLERAQEYVGFCGAFWRCYNDIIPVEIGENSVIFGSNPEWAAFDVLDHRLSEENSDHDIA